MRQAKEVLETWMQHVNGGNVEGLLALYDDSAVLIPTFSSRLLSDPQRIREYFETLASRESLSLELHEKTVKSQAVTDTVCCLSGIYRWRFAIDGEVLNFEARFTYVLDLSLPNPILHHHSSQIPRML